MSEFTEPLSDHTARRIENLDSSRLFDELFLLAAETCLSAPCLTIEMPESSPEGRLVSQLGVRGLRAAVDLASGSAIYMSELSDYVRSDSPIRHPEQFGDSTDFEVMAKVKALGEGLLAEAYLCLGGDVDERIREFAEGETDEDQIKTLGWVHKRLQQLTKAERDNDDPLIYHPARLSPKLVGVYPDHNLPPTCLGVSIIAASFLHQAGAHALHAGVMRTRQERHADDASLFLRDLPQYAQDFCDVTLPANLGDALLTRARSLLQSSRQDNGYHAAAFVRLKSGKWVQLDPNFHASCVVGGADDVRLDEASATLEAMSEVAPGLETTVILPLGTFPLLAEMMIDTGDKTLLGTPEAIRDALLESSEEALPQKVKESFVDPFFKADRGVEGLLEVWQSFMSMATDDESGGEINLFEDGFRDMFRKYVLWETPLADVLQKCRQDEAYLQRRIEDIQALPFMIVA